MIGLTYGLAGLELDEAATQVGRLLDVTFEPRESSYRGGDYFLYRGADHEELILQVNYDPVDRELAEPEAPDSQLLLYVSTHRPDFFERALAQSSLAIVLLNKSD